MRLLLLAIALTQLTACGSMGGALIGSALGGAMAGDAFQRGMATSDEGDSFPDIRSLTTDTTYSGVRSYSLSAEAVTAEQAEVLARSQANRVCASHDKVPVVTGAYPNHYWPPFRDPIYLFQVGFRCIEATE